ncbi:AsmA-like C-terminal region-containing protein [Pelagicoccus sp. SDUM812003]|uniref:AsmA-like C-terminal region-containing protein n=1 Tax=Pelagicoccus sp. SDUM812003 TaxID=3041267 RepID=UPI00280C7A3F|nr:AsmA-like C-terminal region-containing protein [Pelagicoccus sp. SDUM812003]MDQ8202708.1 AsmA-like C-terminal region-containing protein [Pelagicoccus sp. SDUM812003]
MKKPSKSPIRLAWRSVFTTCRATFHCFYSAIVILLFCLTAFAAYVATLDDIPVPNFLIRELRDELRTQGLAIRMDGIRLHPSGRITIERPQFHSQDLGSDVLTADLAVAKLDIAHLLLGRLTIEQVKLSNGRFILPAMIAPSGTPTPVATSISLEARLRGEYWELQYAHLAIDRLRLSAYGTIDAAYLRPKPKPDRAPRASASQTIISIAPQILKLQEQLKRFDQPFALLTLSLDDQGSQTISLRAGAEAFAFSPQLSASGIHLQADLERFQELKLRLEAAEIKLPQDSVARQVILATSWPEIPTKEEWLPNRILASTTTLAYKDVALPSLLASIEPKDNSVGANLQLSLANSPIELRLDYELDSERSSFDLQAELSDQLPEFLAPIAERLAGVDLPTLATVGQPIDLRVQGSLDPKLKPERITATVQSGHLEIQGAPIDRATAVARIEGPQIDLPKIALRSGEQAGVITIGYNLDTLLRRILVEGSFDPTLINDWFKPWWAAMWEGMNFPDEGMYTLLDSQAIFKQPDTVRVTGTGFVKDINLRGIDTEELRLKVYSLFHYVDLYDIELYAKNNQQAFGEIQFHMDRDRRDEKDKLTGIWIDVISTLDLKIGPDVIWEIADSTRKILAPYCYHLPPLVVARSSAFMREDQFIYDIDLDIDSPGPFSYYGYPFDSLSTFVHVANDRVDIPNARASLGGGALDASAFIVGDRIDLDVQLADAGFGRLLNASNTYFLRDGSETAENMDPQRLLNYGGVINASFQGFGWVGDALSYNGQGQLDIHDADFGKFRLLGLLSRALEITPFGFTTLKFNKVASPFSVEKTKVRFSDVSIEGPVASIQASGTYGLETDALDFKARLFPFRNSKVPLITPIINLPLNIVSNALEVTISGTFSEPSLRLFDPSTSEEIGVDSRSTDLREHRPTRR